MQILSILNFYNYKKIQTVALKPSRPLSDALNTITQSDIKKNELSKEKIALIELEQTSKVQ